MNNVPMTAVGAAKLNEELDRLKKVDRPMVIQAIAEARSHGDLKKMPSTMRQKTSKAL